MSDHRRHRSEGRWKRIMPWLGWGALIAFLGGNIVWGFLKEKDDTPQGFLTMEHLQTAALWVPVAAGAVVSILGIYWATKAYAQNERSSLLWARRGCVFCLIGLTGLLMACYEPEAFPREWFIPLAFVVVAGQSVFFGMLSLRELRRASGEGGRRGRSRNADSFGPPAVQTPDVPPAAQSSGPGR